MLSALAEFGPHAKTELAARLDIDRTDTVKTLDDLIAAGYVECVRDTADRRRQLVMLTPTGQVLLDELYAESAAVQDDLLMPLTRGERAQLNALLLRVCASAARAERPRSAPPQAVARWKGYGRRVPRPFGGAALVEGDQGVRVVGDQGEVVADERECKPSLGPEAGQ
nr:MarR family winged helix-turn-helix transcriptional regulator [Kitasatospora sp. GP82]